MMIKPAQRCENQAIFKQNYTLELYNALEMVNIAILVQEEM